ncbi:E3 ubiquitin-protein ligase MARCH5 [Acipenser ruthenus]|uniref:E3 ubiquitin-protein ligase MARCH5 n=1 Tax=Acipenser ruthenus TaxID=7906 RepID=A0A444V1C4_ACIRT|nr:E3 ubiquitin-protein ligase MARCH5 [Acipenser ruthenus]
MERADPLFLLMGLPTIPVMLVLGKMIRWEDYLLRLWQKHSGKLQLLSGLVPGIGRPVPRVPAEVGGGYASDHLSVSRTLCGALVFPSVASLVGRLLFRRVPSNLQRTVLRWLDEKQKGNGAGGVSCPQCGTEYRIVFPKLERTGRGPGVKGSRIDTRLDTRCRNQTEK